MKIKRILGCLCVAVLILSMTACTKSEEKASDDSGSQVEEPVEANVDSKVDLTEAYAAYLSVINENKESIDNYDWQRKVSSDYVTMARQTALCDINGDSVPELFFFTADNEYSATLHIYTYLDDQVQEIDYDFDSDDGTFKDVAVAAGVNYVIYRGKDDQFYVYMTQGDEQLYYTVYSFEVKGKDFRQIDKVQNQYGPDDTGDDGETRMRDVYTKNGSSISSSEGANEFKSAFNQLDHVILFSGYDDTSIWNKFNSGNADSMSADDMIAELQKGTN